MATVAKSPQKAKRLPPLVDGERLNQKTFHERYEAMSDDTRAELIGGIVYMGSPQRWPHGMLEPKLTVWLDEYEDGTPGTELHTHNTQILDTDSEPQPDGCLFISPEFGGQVRRTKDQYLIGAPELMAEISDSTELKDLGPKKRDYEKAGVREYIVVVLPKQKVYWFARRRGKFKELPLGADGIFRSEVFPGLWLDPVALLERDRKRLLAVLRQGLASPEHAAFVEKLRLAAKRTGSR